MKQYQYRAIHTAISTVYGKPIKCEICNGKTTSKRFEWSNKDHRYSLDINDWQQLCASCHRKYDANKFGKNAWNKGITGIQPWHNIEGLNNGEPWNKGKKLTNDQKRRFKISYRKTRAENPNINKNLLENKLINLNKL